MLITSNYFDMESSLSRVFGFNNKSNVVNLFRIADPYLGKMRSNILASLGDKPYILVFILKTGGEGVSQPQARDWYLPVRNQATQQEASGGQATEASSVFTAASQHSHYLLSSDSYQTGGGIRLS